MSDNGFPCPDPSKCTGVNVHRSMENCRVGLAISQSKGDSTPESISTPPSAGARVQSAYSEEELERRKEILVNYMQNSDYYSDFDGKFSEPHAINPKEMSVALLVTEDQERTAAGFPVEQGEVIVETLEVDDDEHPNEVITDYGIIEEKTTLDEITEENGWFRV